MRGDLRRALALVRRRTHRGPPARVQLLEKPDCGLCAEAYRALRRVSLDVPLEIERVDITQDAALFERYALHIPFFTRRLRRAGSAARAAGEKAYLKSDLRFWGTGQDAIRTAVRDYCGSHPNLSRSELR